MLYIAVRDALDGGAAVAAAAYADAERIERPRAVCER
jgi:hypothetical protein